MTPEEFTEEVHWQVPKRLIRGPRWHIYGMVCGSLHRRLNSSKFHHAFVENRLGRRMYHRLRKIEARK